MITDLKLVSAIALAGSVVLFCDQSVQAHACVDYFIGLTGEKTISMPPSVVRTADTYFRGGYAVVRRTSGSYGYLGSDGKLRREQFAFAKNFSEDLAAVVIKGKCGYIDQRMLLTIPAQFEDARDFKEGLAAVQFKGKYGYIDKSGRLVIEAVYDNVSEFSEGIAVVEHRGKIGLLDKMGSWVVEPQFDYASGYSEGLCLVWLHGKTFSFLDRNGKTVISLNPASNKSVYNRIDLLYGRYDLTDQVALSKVDRKSKYAHPVFSPSVFRHGLAPVRQDDKFGYIDKTGRFTIPPQFDFAFPFVEERALVEQNGKFGFIDTSGNMEIAPTFDRAFSFSQGLAAVAVKSRKWGYITPSGHFSINPGFLQAHPYFEGKALVESEVSPSRIKKGSTQALIENNSNAYRISPRKLVPDQDFELLD